MPESTAMIFEVLNDAASRGELLLRDGLICHYHHRRDGQVTICELVVLPSFRDCGLGRHAVELLRALPGATCLLARCPADLPANGFYEHLDFRLEGTQTTRTGRLVNVWRLTL